ncbi:MAG: DEAD/DEAH box helicase [Bacteroidales bacterium]|nr:DEAD/DEAH box helicase [Bacteroidales bacterium]
MDIKKDTGLDSEQLKLLCLMAYLGETPGDYALKQLYGRNHLIAKRNLDILERAKVTKGGRVAPEVYFDVVGLAIDNYDIPTWAEKAHQLRTETTSWLWNVGSALHNGDALQLRRVTRPSFLRADLGEYIGEALLTGDGPQNLARFLTGDEILMSIKRMLRVRFADGTLTEDFWQRLTRYADTSQYITDEVYDMLSAYHFFQFGDWPWERKCYYPTSWSLGVDAIRELYSGKTDEAYNTFQKALQKHDFRSEQKGMFSDPILGWFYSITLYLSTVKPSSAGSRRIQDSIGLMQNNRHFLYSSILAPTRILFTYVVREDEVCANYVEGEVGKLLEQRCVTETKAFCCILLNFFKCMDLGGIKDKYSLSVPPAAAILQNELAPYLPVPTDKKANLEGFFGGTGMTGKIHRRDKWEIIFSDIREKAAEKKNRYSGRIIYFFDGLRLKAIIGEKRLPDGEWDKGILYTRSEFIALKYEEMNTTDIKIAAVLRKLDERRFMSTPEVPLILPLLLGSDRIFVGEYYNKPYAPAEVEVESPWLAFQAVGTEIQITSNITAPKNDGSTIPDSVVTVDDNGVYHVIAMSPEQRVVIDGMLKTGSIPATALASLKQTLEKLDGLVELHTDLANLGRMEEKEGAPVLAVRVKPSGDDYEMTVQAAPLTEGMARFSPGEGGASVYDTLNGHTVAVRRDLVSEYENYDLLRTFFESEIGVPYESYQTARFSASEHLLALMSFVHDNPQAFFMEWPEGEILKFKDSSEFKDVDISVTTNVNWFEVEGSVTLSGKKRSLEEILEMWKDSDVEGYLRVGEREYAKMSKTLQKHLAAISGLGKPDRKGRISVPTVQVGTLAKILGDEGGLHAEMDEGFKGLLARMEAAYESSPELPVGLNATLRDYQMQGYQWMVRLDCWGAGACLADDMGLGKTVQALAFLLHKKDIGPSLVVAPKSVVPNWASEADRFTPSLKVTILNEISDRKTALESAVAGELFLVSYGVLVTSVDILKAVNWNVVCLDEAHQIKNRTTRMSQAAMALNAGSRVILTGTPVQNHLGELWNLMQFVNPGLLGSWTHFKDKYINGPEMDDYKREMLKGLTQPFILRRTKEEVLGELPDKVSYEHMVHLSGNEMAVYENARQLLEVKYKKNKTRAERAMVQDVKVEFFAECTRLRLMANAMELVNSGWKGGSSKVDALKDILSTLMDSGDNRVIIFSQFTSFLEIIGRMLVKQGYQYLYLDGSTPLKERSMLVTKFQSGLCPIFLVSLKAGGLGLNLTAANYVIIADPWWNPAIEKQAEDRAHRMGQERAVTVIRLVAQHTIEEKILRLHETKRELSDTILEGTDRSFKLSMDDVLDMVSPFR